MEHELKCWPGEWDAIAGGDKAFEVRSSRGRDFAVGDTLLLLKWDPLFRRRLDRHDGEGAYLDDHGRCASRSEAATLRRVVTYVLHGGRFGLPDGLCVMSLGRE